MSLHMKGMEVKPGEVSDIPPDAMVHVWCYPGSATLSGVDLALLARRDEGFPLPPSSILPWATNQPSVFSQTRVLIRQHVVSN